MIKSIKLANSYPTSAVGFISKDLSNLNNLKFNTGFSIIILNDFFRNLIEENTINNKIYSLLNSITTETDISRIQEVSETIKHAIMNCQISEVLEDYLNDAYDTLPWEKIKTAKDLLNTPKHKLNIIGSPDYVTAPLIIIGIDKENLKEKIKQAYAHFFSTKEIIYRLNSNIDNKFSLALIMQKYEPFPATAISYLEKQTGKIKIFVFAGALNLNDVINPDIDVSPDYYEIEKDTLKLKLSRAGKQKFKNIPNNGEFNRVECQINSFILNDAIAGEISRLTKKASVLLEKNVQVIFEISNTEVKIMHVSNILDLQKDYFLKTKQIETNRISLIGEEEQEEIINDPDEDEIINKESYISEEKQITEENHIEETEELNGLKEPQLEEPTQEQINQAEEEIEKEELTQEQVVQPKPNGNEFENMIHSDKPLSELMNQPIQEKAQEQFQAEETNKDIIDHSTELNKPDDLLNPPEPEIQEEQTTEEKPKNFDYSHEAEQTQDSKYVADIEENNNPKETITEESKLQEETQESVEEQSEKKDEEINIANSEPISILGAPAESVEPINLNEDKTEQDNKDLNKHNNKDIIDHSTELNKSKDLPAPPESENNNEPTQEKKDEDDFIF
jgi:hypothetical protein